MAEQAITTLQDVQMPKAAMKGKEEYVQGVIRQYQDRLEYIKTNSILHPVILRKRILLWLLRTVITALLYLALWKFGWVRWTLIVTIPLCLLNIISIFTWKNLLRQKLKRNQEELEAMEGLIHEDPAQPDEPAAR